MKKPTIVVSYVHAFGFIRWRLVTQFPLCKIVKVTEFSLFRVLCLIIHYQDNKQKGANDEFHG